MSDIRLFYFPTPNGKKISIALEEMGLGYEIVPVDILRDEQQAPDFLEISPNGRIPALTDVAADGARIRIFESGAILQYLGRKSGKLYPADEAGRAWVDSWLFWQMAGLGPMAGQLSYFLRASKTPGRDPRDTSYALHRYRKEVARLYHVLETRLTGRDFLCDEYGIDDIASWTWIDQYHEQAGGRAQYPAIDAWYARIAGRPAVQRGVSVWTPEDTYGWTAAGQVKPPPPGSPGTA